MEPEITVIIIDDDLGSIQKLQNDLLAFSEVRILDTATTAELSFEERKEILESIRYVKEVVAGPWLITDEFMDSVNCQLLVHGADNVNHVRPERLVIFPRTEGVSSSTLRERVLDCLIQMNIDSKKGNTGDKVARFMIELIKKEFRLE